MTAVASPPSLQPLPRLGWTSSGNGNQGRGDSMSPAEVSRMFARKTPQRTDSSGSLSSTTSNSSTSSTTTINSKDPKARQNRNQEAEWTHTGQSQAWSPQGNPETIASTEISSGRPPTAPAPSTSTPLAQPQMVGLQQTAPVVPSQKAVQAQLLVQHQLQQQQQQREQPQPQQQANGARMAPPPPNTSDPPALLVLLPMNGTFERKQITVPLFPDVLRIGRQTNAKTVPTPANGYFDSKVLSRQHAEVWADRNGKIWIRDVKSSNGTFVNGVRLSPESRDSEPHELRDNDMLELGIDIVSEDQKSIVHHKVSAKVEHAGLHTNAASVLDLNIGDIDPGSGGGVMGPMYPQVPVRGRGGSQGSVISTGRMAAQAMPSNMNGMGVQRHMNWLAPISIEQVVKRLGNELKQAKQQASDLHRTSDFFDAVLTTEPGQAPPKPPSSILPQPPQPNGVNGSPHRADPMSPFAGPPAPPPQQPLPEKPDSARSMHADASLINAIKRVDTEKALSPLNQSPTKADQSHSQILSLAEALASTRKELESQGNRVRFLEESLKQERRARETAEERARHLLERSKSTEWERSSEKSRDDQSDASSVVSTSASATTSETDSHTSGQTLVPSETGGVEDAAQTTKTAEASAALLQERLNLVLHEMEEMKTHMEDYKRRAEDSEQQRNDLAGMVDRIRQEQQESNASQSRSKGSRPGSSSSRSVFDTYANGAAEPAHTTNEDTATDDHTNHANGATSESAKQMQQLQNAVAQALTSRQDDRLAQSAPYASIIGVVLIGVGLMTYLNGWPKVER